MSNIGSSDIIGKQLRAVITTATETELKSFKESNRTCEAKNCIIISVPQKTENDGTVHDAEGKITLWLSDNDGKLIQVTKPIG
jgi:hypothetical protein